MTYNDILRTYNGILKLELHEVELYAIFSPFLPITQVHEARVTKRHYRSLKRHYKLLKNAIIGLNSILRKSSFKRVAFP